MMDRPPTPIPALEKAYEAGKAAGLRGYQIETYMQAHGKCPECGTIAYGIY